jgi:hypothetical protein
MAARSYTSSSGRVQVVWNDASLREWAAYGVAPQAALQIAAKMVEQEMKRLCPVSPVQPVYARRGATVPGGRRFAGDFPLRPSGFLRSSIRARREADGSVIIGPTAPYGRFVNDGTPPHPINSTGPWPLRNRATGQIFGRHVNHPGTTATRFVENSVMVLRGFTVRLAGAAA